jgi:c-di-GMP-related signal transduction protein
MLTINSGVFKYNTIENETVLSLSLSNNGFHQLMTTLPEIFSEYSKKMTVIEFSGTEGDLNELIAALNLVRSKGYKTSYATMCNNVKDLSDKLLDKLDYVRLTKTNKVVTKDYCPFADCYDWI